MLYEHGYVRVEYDDGTIKEVSTYQCGHCGAHKHLKARETPPAICKSCMEPICAWCDDRLRIVGCRTQEQQLERLERAITHRLDWERNFRVMR